MTEHAAHPAPPMPDEFIPLLAAVAFRPYGEVLVTPFPPLSWLHPAGPDGWSFATDSWGLYLRPRLLDEGVEWRLEYHDDEGRSIYPFSVDDALAVIAGTWSPS